MFRDRPLLPAGYGQHHEIDHLAKRRRVVVAEAVLDEHQDANVWNSATAIAQNVARFCVAPVINDVLHHIGARS
jgi:hypothetical protein